MGWDRNSRTWCFPGWDVLKVVAPRGLRSHWLVVVPFTEGWGFREVRVSWGRHAYIGMSRVVTKGRWRSAERCKKGGGCGNSAWVFQQAAVQTPAPTATPKSLLLRSVHWPLSSLTEKRSPEWAWTATPRDLLGPCPNPGPLRGRVSTALPRGTLRCSHTGRLAVPQMYQVPPSPRTPSHLRVCALAVPFAWSST